MSHSVARYSSPLSRSVDPGRSGFGPEMPARRAKPPGIPRKLTASPGAPSPAKDLQNSAVFGTINSRLKIVVSQVRIRVSPSCFLPANRRLISCDARVSIHSRCAVCASRRLFAARISVGGPFWYELIEFGAVLAVAVPLATRWFRLRRRSIQPRTLVRCSRAQPHRSRGLGSSTTTRGLPEIPHVRR
jgi:hypothetical protein